MEPSEDGIPIQFTCRVVTRVPGGWFSARLVLSKLQRRRGRGRFHVLDLNGHWCQGKVCQRRVGSLHYKLMSSLGLLVQGAGQSQVPELSSSSREPQEVP